MDDNSGVVCCSASSEVVDEDRSGEVGAEMAGEVSLEDVGVGEIERCCALGDVDAEVLPA